MVMYVYEFVAFIVEEYDEVLPPAPPQSATCSHRSLPLSLPLSFPLLSSILDLDWFASLLLLLLLVMVDSVIWFRLDDISLDLHIFLFLGSAHVSTSGWWENLLFDVQSPVLFTVGASGYKGKKKKEEEKKENLSKKKDERISKTSKEKEDSLVGFACLVSQLL